MGKIIISFIFGMIVLYLYQHSGASAPTTTAITAVPAIPMAANPWTMFFSLSAKSAAVTALVLTVGLLIVFAMVAEGGFMGGELETMLGAFFSMWIGLFLLLWWLFTP